MKKQINPTTKAHLLRGAFYLLLLLAVCAIPFALAQSRSRGTTKRSVGKPLSQTIPVNPASGVVKAAPPSTGAVGASGAAESPAGIPVQGHAGTSDNVLDHSQSQPAGGCQFHVLIVYADTEGLPTQLQSEIQAEPNVIAVDLFDANVGTPTLGQLQQYQIVVPFSNSTFLDPDTLGNNLADYVDGGGIVVQYGFAFYGPGQPYGVNGRWVTGNYNAYSYSTNLQGNAFSLGTFNAGHPLMAGVTTLNSNFANIVTLAAGATEVAADNLGDSLVAYRPVSGGHTTVGVTAYVGAASTQSGHWGRVIVNAGNWLANCQGGTPSPTPTATATPTGSPSCTPAWQNEPPMLAARAFASGAVANNFFYVLTGFNGSSYEVGNDYFNGSVWASGAPIPVGHSQSKAAAVGNNIYVPGGYNSLMFSGPIDLMQIYNTTTNTWSNETLFTSTTRWPTAILPGRRCRHRLVTCRALCWAMRSSWWEAAIRRRWHTTLTTPRPTPGAPSPRPRLPTVRLVGRLP